MENLKNAEISMMMILHAGDALNLAMSALRKVRTDDYDEATVLIEEAKAKSVEAHKIQTELLTQMMNGSPVEMDLLLVHAQDHLMNSILMIDIAEEMIEIFKAKNK